MRSSSFQLQLRAVLVIFAACFAFTVARGQNPTHVITGTVEKVDAGAKTVAVKTADGTVETVKFTEKTTVHGLKDAAKGADLVGKKPSKFPSMRPWIPAKPSAAIPPSAPRRASMSPSITPKKPAKKSPTSSNTCSVGACPARLSSRVPANFYFLISKSR